MIDRTPGSCGNLEQVIVTNEGNSSSFNENDNGYFFISRLGCPNPNANPSKMAFALKGQLADLLNRLYDTIYVENGRIVLLQENENEDTVLKALVYEIIGVYFTAKLTSLKRTFRISGLEQYYEVFLRLFEDLLKFYSHRNDSEDPVSPFHFNTFLALGFLVSAVSRFIDEEAQARTEPALALLISFAQSRQLAETFKMILPPAHQSRLFVLTLYRDILTVETKFEESGERENVSKLKAIMEVAFKRYGDHFLSFYSDELFVTFDTLDLMDCPHELWNLATQGNGTGIQTELGPSFLVNLIKYQWGIIKDFNGVVPDPTNDIILVHPGLVNLFEFLQDQAQQLFLLISTLHQVLNDETHMRTSFRTDSDTLIRIYVEIMDHVTRLSSALTDEYTVLAQSDNDFLSRKKQVEILQATKYYILLISLSLCSIQLSLTGPLHISTAPSFSQIVEFYISSSDFTAARMTCTINPQFAKQFRTDSQQFFTHYPMIKDLSKLVLNHLSMSNSNSKALGTEFSWNFLSFCVFILVALIASSLAAVSHLLKLIDDYFLY